MEQKHISVPLVLLIMLAVVILAFLKLSGIADISWWVVLFAPGCTASLLLGAIVCFWLYIYINKAPNGKSD